MRTTPSEHSLPAAGEATHAGGTSSDLGVPGEGLPTIQEAPAEMGIRPTDPRGPSRSPVLQVSQSHGTPCPETAAPYFHSRYKAIK